MKDNILVQVGVLTLILVTATFLLTYTNSFTEDIVEKNQQEEFNEKVRQIFPATERTEDAGDYYRVYDSAEELLGYAVVSSKYGYQSDIRLLVGFSSREKIKSVVILEQAETPGLGTKITGNDFINQFNGKTCEQTKLKSKSGEIDAISGATISSSAVVEAANKAFEKLD